MYFQLRCFPTSAKYVSSTWLPHRLQQGALQLKRWNIFVISVTSPEQKFEENKTTYIVLITIWSYRCTTHHSPGMNRKIKRYKAHIEAVLRALWFLCLLSSKDGSQRHCASDLQAGTRVRKTPNSSILGPLSNSVCRHKWLWLQRGCNMLQPSCC